jgi:hypothetical protein
MGYLQVTNNKQQTTRRKNESATPIQFEFPTVGLLDSHVKDGVGKCTKIAACKDFLNRYQSTR